MTTKEQSLREKMFYIIAEPFEHDGEIVEKVNKILALFKEEVDGLIPSKPSLHPLAVHASNKSIDYIEGYIDCLDEIQARRKERGI